MDWFKRAKLKIWRTHPIFFFSLRYRTREQHREVRKDRNKECPGERVYTIHRNSKIFFFFFWKRYKLFVVNT